MDDNKLILKDADAESSNRYSVRMLGDAHDAFNVSHNTLPIEVPRGIPYTAIFTSESIFTNESYVFPYSSIVLASFSIRICLHRVNFCFLRYRNIRENHSSAKVSVSRDPASEGRVSDPRTRRKHGESQSIADSWREREKRVSSLRAARRRRKFGETGIAASEDSGNFFPDDQTADFCALVRNFCANSQTSGFKI